MKSLVFALALSAILSQSCFADAGSVDGVWHMTNTSYGVSSDWTSDKMGYWENGAVAGGPNATAMLHVWPTYSNWTATFKPTEAIVLHNLFVSGCYNMIFDTTKNEMSKLQMKNNPSIISVEPRYTGATSFTGDNAIQGDGTTLTFGGNMFNFNAPTAGAYSISGFDSVDVKNCRDFSARGKGGIVNGDLRLSASYLNVYVNDASVTNAPVSGDLTIGEGLSVIGFPNNANAKAKMLLPSVIRREPKGILSTLRNAAITNKVVMSNAAAYMNDEGRFPTWFLDSFMSDGGENKTFDFLSYDAEIGFKRATIPNVNNLSASTTPNQTVLITTATTLNENATAAAVRVGAATDAIGQLTLNEGVTLTLGNENEPGVFMFNTARSVNGNGELTFAGPEGILILNGGVNVQNFNARLTGANSLTVLSGTWECVNVSDGHSSCATLDLKNANNTFSGGMDVLMGMVRVSTGDAAGTGPIRVYGHIDCFNDHQGNPMVTDKNAKPFFSYGGAFSVTSGTITNQLILAGGGHYPGQNPGRAWGSLVMSGSTTVTGPITLSDDVLIGANVLNNADKGPCTLASAISGEHTVYLWPWTTKTMRFDGSVAAETKVVISAPQFSLARVGTVSIGEAATFECENVVNNATMVFESERTFDNVLSGIGTYKQTEDFNMVFTKDFEQGRLAIENGAVALKGDVNKLGTLDGTGDLKLADGAQLTIGADCSWDGNFSGDIVTPSGSATITKEGDATLTLGRVPSFNGDLVVNSGTVQFGETIDRTMMNAKVTVGENGVIDLVGNRLNLDELENEGLIMNSSDRVVTLSVKKRSGRGVIAPNVNLIKTGLKIIIR